MPVLTLEGPALSKEQKTRLIRELTASASAILNIPEHAFTVLLRENHPDNIGVGGKPLSDR